MHIDQVKLVFDVKGVETHRYIFETADVFDLDLSHDDPFDIVLCLGLFYHVSRPIELMERMSAWNTDLLVLDTSLEPVRGAYARYCSGACRQRAHRERARYDELERELEAAREHYWDTLRRLAVARGVSENMVLAWDSPFCDSQGNVLSRRLRPPR
jgi:hypothetical protein